MSLRTLAAVTVNEAMVADVLEAHDVEVSERQLDDLMQALDLEAIELAAGYANTSDEQTDALHAEIWRQLEPLLA